MSAVDEVTVALTPEMARSIRRAVAAGEYGSPGEAVQAALRDWLERRDTLGYAVEELRALVQEGIDSGPSQYGSVADVIAEDRRRRDDRS